MNKLILENEFGILDHQDCYIGKCVHCDSSYSFKNSSASVEFVGMFCSHSCEEDDRMRDFGEFVE